MSGAIQARIENKITNKFSPLYLQLTNESGKHSSGMNNPQAETHFKLVLVSNEFKEINLVNRHRLIYQLLDEELKGGVHALSLQLFAPQEWQGKVVDTPPCAGENH